MGRQAQTKAERQQPQYDVETEWSPADRKLLEELKRAETQLPEDAPRALLSVRLSVLTDETTSPVRQELDLRLLARDMGVRVVGVASDLNVSATKVPPWKRKQLGDWLNNRAPEFDVLLFWKMDRFVRRLSDLSTMIDWCLKYGKNLVSKNDSIDLSTVVGKIMVTLIGGLAEIEASNTSTRVTSLWDYTKTQGDWLVGKPAYGYVTAEGEDGKTVLAFDDTACKVLRWCHRRASKISASQMVRIIKRAGVPDAKGLTTSTLLRRLKNPALMGYRVEEDKSGVGRKSKLVLGKDGKPIKVAEPIFSEEEFTQLQKDLETRARNQPARQEGGASRFLGVLICKDCKTNLTVQVTTTKGVRYRYMRCSGCKAGGPGVNNPDVLYSALVTDVLKVLGDEPVLVREYAKGAEALKNKKRLEESVSYYMKGLEPGGRFDRSPFTRQQAEETLDQLISDLSAIDPESTQDRWVNAANGKSFRQHWEEGGMEAMSADLLRVGIKCAVARTKVPGQRQPSIHLKLMIPKDVKARLVVKEDDFGVRF
ncbi:recombinase family protein [Kitasatospora sp. NPDC050543]|uniref:recombinase family protein n=1 Tax=Kitasatospora sp. NPDC050543 TaxID=3364054 RepID=UPI00378F980D